MNDVERLAEALRQANAELQVDPAELAAAMQRGHRRLVWRLLLVAVLSAVGAALLLSGSLAASDAIKEHRHSSANDNGKPSKASGEKRLEGNNQNGPGNSTGGKNNSGSKDEKRDEKKKQPDRSDHAIGGGTEAKVEELPELVVTDVTATEVVVKNESSVEAEPFYVLVTVTGTEFEEKIEFEKGLAGGEPSRRKLKEEPPCSSEAQIVAVVDAGEAVTESEDDNNKTATDCKELQSEEEKEVEPSSAVD